MQKPRINVLAKQNLAALRGEGIELSDVDVITIYKLARRALECAPQSELLLNTGKRVGNIQVFPLTLGAKLWLMTVAMDWFEDDDVMLGLATVYAVAHARDIDKFTFQNGRDAKRLITAWALRVNLSEQEIMQVTDHMVGHEVETSSAGAVLVDLIEQIQEHPTALNLSAAGSYIAAQEVEQENSPFVEYIAALQRNYGGTREHWLWDESDDLSMEMIRATRKHEQSKQETAAPDPFDPCVKAYRELHTYCTTLRLNHAAR